MIKILLILLTVNVFSSNIQANNLCSSDLGTLPIRQNGRTKPLLVHAKDVLKYLSGESKDVVNRYCLLSTSPKAAPMYLKIKNESLREFLGLEATSYTELLEREEEMLQRYRRTREHGPLRKPLGQVLAQMDIYKDIVSGENWLLPQVSAKEVAWVPIKDIPSALSRVDEIHRDYQRVEGTMYLLEYRFVRANLVLWAMLFTFLSLASLTVFRKFKLTISLVAATVVIQIAIISLRVVISGRAPITNMYETVLFSGFGALLLSIVIASLKREKVFIYLGLAYNAISLMMLKFATGMLSDSINPLVPVLRDNFWLSTHVTTIIMSYGALALSWVLANGVLLGKYLGKITPADQAHYSRLTYTCLKWGTTMLAAGIILGGVWADYSWGRFWGWDPKETWSLIAFCIYMAIIHGRYTNWLSPHRFLVCTAVAFLSIIMAWFGVNYILAAGLHSYGFSEGGAVFILSVFAVQITALMVIGRNKRLSNLA